MDVASRSRRPAFVGRSGGAGCRRADLRSVSLRRWSFAGLDPAARCARTAEGRDTHGGHPSGRSWRGEFPVAGLAGGDHGGGGALHLARHVGLYADNLHALFLPCESGARPAGEGYRGIRGLDRLAAGPHGGDGGTRRRAPAAVHPAVRVVMVLWSFGLQHHRFRHRAAGTGCRGRAGMESGVRHGERPSASRSEIAPRWLARYRDAAGQRWRCGAGVALGR